MTIKVQGNRTNEPSKSFECPGDASLRIDLNEDVLAGMEVNLEQPRLVEGAVKEVHQGLGHELG